MAVGDREVTIHVTWAGVLELIGAGALALLVLTILWAALKVILFVRGMK